MPGRAWFLRLGDSAGALVDLARRRLLSVFVPPARAVVLRGRGGRRSDDTCRDPLAVGVIPLLITSFLTRYCLEGGRADSLRQARRWERRAKVGPPSGSARVPVRRTTPSTSHLGVQGQRKARPSTSDRSRRQPALIRRAPFMLHYICYVEESTPSCPRRMAMRLPVQGHLGEGVDLTDSKTFTGGPAEVSARTSLPPSSLGASPGRRASRDRQCRVGHWPTPSKPSAVASAVSAERQAADIWECSWLKSDAHPRGERCLRPWLWRRSRVRPCRHVGGLGQVPP